jgi:ABC-type transport system substrate-binding protein
MTGRALTSSVLLVRIGLGMLLLGGLFLAVSATNDLRGQADAPAKKQRVEEEEEDVKKPPKRKVIRIEDEEVKPKAQAAPSAVPVVADLGQAAEQARHFGIKALFRDLAVPHDMVVFNRQVGIGTGRREDYSYVEPLKAYLAEGTFTYRGPALTLHLLDQDWKPSQTYTPGMQSIKFVRPYERLAIEAVEAFLNEPFDKLTPENPKHLSRYDMLLAGEQVLTAVLRFHESARERGLRVGEEWDRVEAEVRKHLLDKVMLGQLEWLAEFGDWDKTLALTRRLAETYTKEEDRQAIGGPLANLFNKILRDPTGTDERKREARKRLHELEEQFPNNKVFNRLNEEQQKQAQHLLDQARELGKEREDKAKRERALAMVIQAEEIWPQLPGLRTYHLLLSNDYPILKVGVRGVLPRRLSPALACTDSELRAVELLFESLVKLIPDDSGIFRYQPCLAQGRPRVVPLGRQFQLPRNALWSNEQPLNAGDIRQTVRLLKDEQGKGTGRSSAWGALLDRVEVSGDPFQVTLRLNQGYVDPLSMMTFKILPTGMRTDTEKFAENPVTSGPYRLEGSRSDEERRPYLGFGANPYYESRPGKRGLPVIQEVRFYVYSDALKEFRTGKLDLALDLTAKEATDLRQQMADKVHVLVPPTKPNRRIYFLAINQHKVQDANARKALAHAINREALLDQHFRGPLGREVHQALNGPFPAKSWACNPALVNRANKASLDLFDPALARTLSKQPAAQKLLAAGPLSLKYPEGDPALEEAMTALRDGVKETLGVEVELVKRDPYKLHEDVELTQSYDLAYYHYDFPDEAYWLRPLLGHGNFLNFQDDSVQPLLEVAMGHRNFAEVQKYMQTLHEVLYREMPLIPLWQLDPLLAHSSAVRPVGLDPLLVFPDIEEWRLHRQ